MQRAKNSSYQHVFHIQIGGKPQSKRQNNNKEAVFHQMFHVKQKIAE